MYLVSSVSHYFRGVVVLTYPGMFCVLYADDLRSEIQEEAHGYLYSIHPCASKMYSDFQEVYWWNVKKGYSGIFS